MLEDENIPVVKSEQFATFRQEIRPATQDSVSSLLTALIRILQRSRFTGHITLTLNHGGVRTIITDQKTSMISENSAAGKAIDSHFKK